MSRDKLLSVPADTSIPIVSIAVTGGVALVVPVVAALWARSNQKEQHRHDREMRDLEELRRLLDDAAERLADAEVADRQFRQLEVRRDLQELDERSLDEYVRLAERCWDTVHLALASQERISMRIGRETEIRRHYYAAARALLDLITLKRDEEDFDEARTALNRHLASARTRFVDAAYERVASKLPTSE